jgi:excisionase family DNA binding protein
MHPEWLTVQETAEYLHSCAETVKRLLRKGELPGIKVGRRWLVPKAQLIEYLLSRLTTECRLRRDEVSL